MADRQPYRIRPGVRYFLDADGFCWQEIQDTGHGLGVMHSMARVNPDNSPTPEPYLYLIPEDELPTWLLMPWWQRVSYWLRPYWHATDSRVWRWQRKPCMYPALPTASTGQPCCGQPPGCHTWACTKAKRKVRAAKDSDGRDSDDPAHTDGAP